MKMMKAYQAEDIQVGRPETRRKVEVEESLERLSWLLDDLFRVPVLGWRIGLDALVGLVPGVGDTATTLASLYILTSAVRYRVPKITLLRMGLNLGIDYVLGALPLVGDLFDAWWKSNNKNIALLRERATVSASEAREGTVSDWLFVGLIILLLIGLAVGAAAISLFLLVFIVGQLNQAFAS
jgi:hypothetical protein